MPGWSIDQEFALYQIAHLENALFDGYSINPIIGQKTFGAIREAADRIGISDQTLRRRVGTPKRPAAIFRRYGFTVDWSMYRERVGRLPGSKYPPVEAPEIVSVPEPDHVKYRQAADREAAWRARAIAAEKRAAEAENIQASVFKLIEEPLKPRLVIPGAQDNAQGGRTVVLHLSDIHYGETVLTDEMDGANHYNPSIAKARLGRFFDKSARLMTDYWTGPSPDEIILCLGGDLISGNIHPELAETNEPAVPATVREIGEHIAGGLVSLRTRVGCPVRVYSVPGNHGRMTVKPQSKGRAAGSLDLLATDFAEATFKGAGLDGVAFYRTASPDAYFSVYGWHFGLTHGDAMGSRGGGTGFIGPVASILKGHRKFVDTSWRQGRPIHYVLSAHYHTTCRTPFGWGNGSTVGYGEYARDLRADPEGARQNMLVVHPRHGVINHLELHLGSPSEGSHYAGPASVVRPTWDGVE